MRKIALLFLALSIISNQEALAGRFGGGALAGGVIGGFAAGALLGNALGRRSERHRYQDSQPYQQYNNPYYGPPAYYR